MSIWDELKLVHLASNASFNRGLGYYQGKAVLNGEESGNGVYKGQVSGSQDNIYDVVININHPRKSVCTCPFAAGRQVICKHMVALYFFFFLATVFSSNLSLETAKLAKYVLISSRSSCSSTLV